MATRNTVSELREDHVEWLQDNFQRAWEFVGEYGSPDAPRGGPYPPALPALDEAYLAWCSAPAKERVAARHVLQAVGIALGQHLVGAGGLRWVVAGGECGSGLAVTVGDRVVDPIELVTRHYAEGSHGFLIGILASTLGEHGS